MLLLTLLTLNYYKLLLLFLLSLLFLLLSPFLLLSILLHLLYPHRLTTRLTTTCRNVVVINWLLLCIAISIIITYLTICYHINRQCPQFIIEPLILFFLLLRLALCMDEPHSRIQPLPLILFYLINYPLPLRLLTHLCLLTVNTIILSIYWHPNNFIYYFFLLRFLLLPHITITQLFFNFD